MSSDILCHVVLPAAGWFHTAWNIYLSTSARLRRHSELNGVLLGSCFWPRADVWGLRGQSPLWSLHNRQSSSLFAISAIISVTENKALSEEEEAAAMALGASLCGGHGLQLYHRSDKARSLCGLGLDLAVLRVKNSGGINSRVAHHPPPPHPPGSHECECPPLTDTGHQDRFSFGCQEPFCPFLAVIHFLLFHEHLGSWRLPGQR